MCRAVSDRRLEVGAHPGRDDSSVRVLRPQSSGHLPRDGQTPASGSSGPVGQQPSRPEAEPGASLDRRWREPGRLRVRRPRVRARSSSETWIEAVEVRPASVAARLSAGHERAVGRPTQRRRRSSATDLALFVCSCPMKCQTRARCLQRRRLRCGLLVSVLSDVTDAEVSEYADVVGREGLGHHDSPTDPGTRAGCCLCCHGCARAPTRRPAAICSRRVVG